MKISFFPNKSLLSQVKFVWKTLVVLILSVLLFAPAPVLALDYYSTPLKSYIPNVKVELDGVLTSIKKLPNLSYDNGRTTLTDIDKKLAIIKTNAGKNAANFQTLSDEAQQDYEYLLQIRSLNSQAIVKRDIMMRRTLQRKLWPYIDLNREDIFLDSPVNIQELRDLRTIVNNIRSVRERMSQTYKTEYDKLMLRIENMQSQARELRERIKRSLPRDQQANIDLNQEGLFVDYLNKPEPLRSLAGDLENIEESIRIGRQVRLEAQESNIAKGIVLTNKISKLCDDLEKRIKLAIQKFGNVQEYADALNSFNDPDVLYEINDLDEFITDLTKNLSNA